MDRTVIGAVIRKDLRVAARNRGVRIPLLVAPTLLVVVVPAFLVLGGELLGAGTVSRAAADDAAPFQTFIPALMEANGDEPITWARLVLEYLIAPLYLLVPLVVSTVLAADAFAGERERRTLEALLHTASSDRDLFLGKLLAAYLPAVASSWLAFVVYAAVANLLGATSGGADRFPTPTWVLLAFWVAPAVSLLGIGLMVGISSRVRSLQAAHQIGSLLVLPFLLLLVAQVTGMMVVEAATMLAFGALLWVGGGLVLLVNLRTFDRDAITSRL